ncbi:periplasmic component of amino acid ABC-type transporter/signal transduction system [Saccharomonospora marina XMU15]|uniref:Periplasmic component of amino acid ABC-type transporter/signal transduction system n=1 Tax=Saccharomonospora marina XMU15 TaxID=882083 RepID=H5X7K8_9PSEU|nr:transporter substrate-binding domain-containing protein [Saccharomonospora marina]EHR51300.1 periplasmic component of amino acid ABC-type transporter/signal transduction system [Saccharomonospora marina XMU15]
MRHPSPRHRILAIVASAALLATACGASSDPADSPDGPAAGPGSSALHDELPQSVKDAGVLRFAGDSHPPYRTVGPDGKTVTGIDKDFQDALGEVLGVRTETVIVSGLPAALQGMLSGRYDAFNGPVKATEEREQQFDTITWMTTRTSYVVPTGPSSGIESAGDLCGKRVAVVKASIVEEQLTKLSRYCQDNGKQPAETIGLDDTNATILATRSGRADAAGMTQAAAIDVTKEQQDAFTYVTQTDEQGATSDHLALFVPKDSELGPVLHKAFQELFANGRYREIMRHWGLTDVMVEQPLLNVATTQGR